MYMDSFYYSLQRYSVSVILSKTINCLLVDQDMEPRQAGSHKLQVIF